MLLVIAPLARGILERMGIPALVGYILLGIAISALNEHWPFINGPFENTISIFAELGVVVMLFRVGLKSHTSALLKKLPDASLIWIGDVLTNLAFGFVVATAFSATSVAVSVVVWDETRKLNTGTGQLLVDVAELDDLSGVLLLALLLAAIPLLGDGEVAIWTQVSETVFVLILKLALFIAGCFVFSHFLERRFTRVNRKWANSTTGMTISVLGAGLGIAAVAGYLGFSLAVGALFAGLAFSRDPEAVRAEVKIVYLHDFLAPFFFIHIGMQVNPETIAPSLGMAMLLFIPAVLGKFIGVAGPALRILSPHEAILLGVSMIPRAEIAMIIMYQCRIFGENIVPNSVYTAMVLVAVMTSILAPLFLRRLL
jgi:Kef-type K+ transport system membrane component KefB